MTFYVLRTVYTTCESIQIHSNDSFFEFYVFKSTKCLFSSCSKANNVFISCFVYLPLLYNLNDACFDAIFISDCSFPIDIALAIDASGSVGNRSFQLVREFLKLFTQHFDVTHMVRFACLHYDHFVYKDFSFKDEQFRNRTNLEEKLQKMSYPSGATLTHQALIELIKFFGIGNGARNASEVRRVSVVLTDGRTYGGKRKLIPPVDYLKVRYKLQ